MGPLIRKAASAVKAPPALPGVALTVLALLSIGGCHGGGGGDSAEPPLAADAGVDQVVDEGSLAQLAGSSANNEGAVTFFWQQLSGPSVTLSSTTTANPSFTTPWVAIGTTASIELRVTVTDAAGTVAVDSVQVTVRSSDWLTFIDSSSGSAGLYAFDAETRVTRKLADSIIRAPRIAPDASRIAYIDAAFDVWTVRPDGTERAKIGNSRLDYTSFINPNAGISTSDDVNWSPDGMHLQYSADRDLNGAHEYYVARADGSREVQLDNYFGSFRWAPDGSRISYSMRRPGEYPWQFYSARPDGTGLAKLTDAAVDGWVRFWDWSPDSTHVAYEMALPGPDPPSFRDYGLFTVRADGTERMRALDNIFTIGLVMGWLPTGTLLALADPGRTGHDDLFTVRADGSALMKVNGPYAQPGGIRVLGWSPDVSRICYETTGHNGDIFPLHVYTARPDGTGRARLNDAPGAWGCGWAPDGSRIVYRGPLTEGGVDEFFSVRPDGTERVRLNVPAGGQLRYWLWSPASTHIAYIGEQTGRIGELHVVRADGTSRVKINGPLGPERSVYDPNCCFSLIRWAPDGSRFIYAETQRYAGSQSMIEYFSVLPDGTRSRLHSPTSRYSSRDRHGHPIAPGCCTC